MTEHHMGKVTHAYSGAEGNIDQPPHVWLCSLLSPDPMILPLSKSPLKWLVKVKQREFLTLKQPRNRQHKDPTPLSTCTCLIHCWGFGKHGCCWETFYIFAYCGLVGNPHLTARFFSLLPFQPQPSGWQRAPLPKLTRINYTWPWGITYGSILGWMNIHLPPILMFTRGTGF